MEIQDSLIASINALPAAPTHYTLAIYEGDAPITGATLYTTTNSAIAYDAAAACAHQLGRDLRDVAKPVQETRRLDQGLQD